MVHLGGKGGSTAHGYMTMAHCPIHRPVHVREYVRFRLGRWETVTSHCRHLPKR